MHPLHRPERLESQLRVAEHMFRQSGLDLLRWFSVEACNSRVGGDAQLATFGHRDALGLLIGNTRALWRPFMRWFNDEDAGGPLPGDRPPHPLDRYVDSRLENALSLIKAPHWLGLAHQTQPKPIPLQRYAQAAGLAHLGPAHLSVHPEYGVWVALRAIVVFDVPTSALTDSLIIARNPAHAVCSGCDAPCTNRELHRVGDPKTRGLPELPLLSTEQKGWLAARDACPVGRVFRYSGDQITYHYSGYMIPG